MWYWDKLPLPPAYLYIVILSFIAFRHSFFLYPSILGMHFKAINEVENPSHPLNNWPCMHAESLHSSPTLKWTAACQTPLSLGFSRKEHWSGLPCPPPGDLPDPGIKPASLTSPALAGGFCATSAPREALIICWPDVFVVSQLCLQGLDTTERLNSNQLPLLVWNVPLLLCWI